MPDALGSLQLAGSEVSGRTVAAQPPASTARWTFQLFHDNRGWLTHPRTFASQAEAQEFVASHPAFYPKRVIRLD